MWLVQAVYMLSLIISWLNIYTHFLFATHQANATKHASSLHLFKDEEPFKQSACSRRGKLHVELIFLVKKQRKRCVWSQLRLLRTFLVFSGLFWSCWLSRIVLFRQRRQPQGPNSYFKDHRRWSLYKYWIAGLCATHPQESNFNHSHTSVSGWRSNWCNIFQLLSMWLWSDFRAELWFHALSSLRA